MVDRPSFDSSFTEESSISPRACPALHWGLRGCESEARRGVSPAINLGGEECRSPVRVCWLLNYGHRGHKACRFSDGASNLVSCRTGCRRASAIKLIEGDHAVTSTKIELELRTVLWGLLHVHLNLKWWYPPKTMKHMMQGAVFCLGGILTLTMNGS